MISPIPPLLAIAERVVWFEPPRQTLCQPLRFLAYLMALGTWEEVQLVRQYAVTEQWREALRQAPPGIIDARSWAYWHAVLGVPLVPLPVRRL